jgi:D-alanyl-D-alanine dipeptidase
MKQPLALTLAHLHTVALVQMMTEKFAIPKVLGVPKIKRQLAKINANRFTHTLVYNCRTARPRCILKPSKTALLKASNPILDAATALTEKFRDCRTAKSTADQKNPVQAMIVSRFLRSLNLVYDRESDDVSISNLQLAHSPLLLGAMVSQTTFMRNYL